jgi:hypothetical protein
MNAECVGEPIDELSKHSDLIINENIDERSKHIEQPIDEPFDDTTDYTKDTDWEIDNTPGYSNYNNYTAIRNGRRVTYYDKFNFLEIPQLNSLFRVTWELSNVPFWVRQFSQWLGPSAVSGPDKVVSTLWSIDKFDLKTHYNGLAIVNALLADTANNAIEQPECTPEIRRILRCFTPGGRSLSDCKVCFDLREHPLVGGECGNPTCTNMSHLTTVACQCANKPSALCYITGYKKLTRQLSRWITYVYLVIIVAGCLYAHNTI